MYVDLVTVKTTDGNTILRTAPFSAGLKEGDQVMVEVEGHPFEAKGEVIDIATFNADNEEYTLITNFCKDAKMKVTKKIIYQEMVFDKGVG